jgi:hypothetical protein
VSGGRYRLYVGDSSASLPLRVTIRRAAARLAPGVW